MLPIPICFRASKVNFRSSFLLTKKKEVIIIGEIEEMVRQVISIDDLTLGEPNIYIHLPLPKKKWILGSIVRLWRSFMPCMQMKQLSTIIPQNSCQPASSWTPLCMEGGGGWGCCSGISSSLCLCLHSKETELCMSPLGGRAIKGWSAVFN